MQWESILFALFVNDLQNFFELNDCRGIYIYFDASIDMYFKIMMLLYADDTVILAETALDLQHSLNCLYEYSSLWKLNVNRSKTKIVIFGSNTRSIRNEYIFYYNGELLEIVTCYKYLGLLFCNNGNFYRSKVQLKDQAEKAMFSLLNKSNELGLPIDVQLELFDKTVLPVMLYGCEIWGYENINLFESFYLRYLKYILKLKKSTPNCMLYGELGVYKIDITVKCRMISFWLKLATDDNENKFAVKMFYI